MVNLNLVKKRITVFSPNLTVFYRVQYALLYIENDAKILTAHYAWKVAEKEFNMAFMLNKLAIINSCEIILEI